MASEIALGVAVEVDRGGVDEDQVELGREQVAVLEEQPLLEFVPDRRQPRQCAVEVVQGKRVEPRRLDARRPSRALQIRARGAQALQGERERHAFGIEAEPALLGQPSQDLGQTLAFPQPPEDQRRAPALGRAGDEALVLGCLNDLQPRAEPSQRLQEVVELAGGDEQIPTAEARHQFLPHPLAVPHGAHDLQVLVALAVLGHRLDSDEHA
jgi:hypothetical protein